jgi:predicted MPP superfamily phosphohydrolase
MNEILFGAQDRRRSGSDVLRQMLWSAAKSCALGGLYTWGLQKYWLRIEQHPMPLKNLGDCLCGLRLAHISDLHCSPIVRERYLHQCVEIVNSMNVDFVVVTGDLLTGAKHYARRVARVLRELDPRIATLACLGNHDYGIWHPRGRGAVRGLAEYVTEQLTFADIFVMTNESRTFSNNGSAIQFVGVEDYWTTRYDPDLAFEVVNGRHPSIALCHNPDGASDMVRRGAQWVLSGHTHGNSRGDTRLHDLVLPKNHKHFVAGRYSLGNGSYLYVNRGLGYARRANLNTRPEITIFTLCKSD